MSRLRFGENLFGIVGGDELVPSDRPWALKLTFPNDRENFCTGTFVSHNTMLTAAHCVDEHRVVTLDELGGVRSNAVHQYPRNIVRGVIDANDVAVVLFPDHTAKAFTKLADRAPAKGDSVFLVGYGSCVKFLGPTDTMGRCGGKNVIDAIESDSRIRSTAKDGVFVSKGDSGGPLLTDGDLLIGVANVGNGKLSHHANLFSDLNLKWLRKVTKEPGVIVCGLDGRECDDRK
jgi:secreted trypsin-like serine protease